MKHALVLGAGGFIGSHLVQRLRGEGYWVMGVDLKYPEFAHSAANVFEIQDLRRTKYCDAILEGYGVGEHRKPWDEVYQLAADMGGAGFVFTGENDADIMHNSGMINMNVAHGAARYGVKKVLYTSSACIYPERNQLDPDNPNCAEDSAYPAAPDSDYGWEKIFSERIYAAFQRNYGLNIRVARLHNIFGPEGTWDGGREKAPAALCRKVAAVDDGGTIEIWGDGKQTRSFLYIDECLEGLRRLMDSDHTEPINLGSDEMVTINQLAELVIDISGKSVELTHIDGPLGVRGRNSDNKMIEQVLGWRPAHTLKSGLGKTYPWILEQMSK